MKTQIERRAPSCLKDFFALAVTTFGVGYLPLMPGTYGSAVGIGIYLFAAWCVNFVEHFVNSHHSLPGSFIAWTHAIILIAFLLFCLLGIWAAGRSTSLLGNSDPPETVVDEVIGQLIVFLFVPFGIGWPFILAGFLLFRLFDIWKPSGTRAGCGSSRCSYPRRKRRHTRHRAARPRLVGQYLRRCPDKFYL